MAESFIIQQKVNCTPHENTTFMPPLIKYNLINKCPLKKKETARTTINIFLQSNVWCREKSGCMKIHVNMHNVKQQTCTETPKLLPSSIFGIKKDIHIFIWKEQRNAYHLVFKFGKQITVTHEDAVVEMLKLQISETLSK